MYDLRAADGFAVFTYFGSFYTLAIFVFLNLFVAVLLEAFENEFDASTELDLSAEDIVFFKDLWDDKIDLCVRRQSPHHHLIYLPLPPVLTHMQAFIPLTSAVGVLDDCHALQAG